MRKIFQKWNILNVSEESLTIAALFKPIQSQDTMRLYPSGAKIPQQSAFRPWFNGVQITFSRGC
jgi:hypothetical protein